MMILVILSKICILIGAFFMFVAALGVLRMTDIYMRLHTNTKSATFGSGFLLSGAAFHFIALGEWLIMFRAIIIIIFLFVTAPVAAHMIGRAAYFVKAPAWKGTLSDEMEGKYDPETHELTGMKNTRKSKITNTKREKTKK